MLGTQVICIHHPHGHANNGEMQGKVRLCVYSQSRSESAFSERVQLLVSEICIYLN